MRAGLLAVVALDMGGFGMLIPDVQLHGESLGMPGWAIGAALSSMFLVQVLVSGRWGRLSDRWGRKPVIVACTLLSAGAMALYAVAFSPWLIVASRMLAGLGAANVAVANAFASDYPQSPERSRLLGQLAAAASLGLVAGPALGGWLSSIGQHVAVGGVAAGLSVAGATAAWALLPNHRGRGAETTEDRKRTALWRHPAVLPLIALSALSWTALAGLEGTFGRMIRANLGYGAFEFGMVFGYEALLAFLVQIFLVAWAVGRFRNDRLLPACYVAMGMGLAAMPFAWGMPTLLAASTAYALGSGLATPVLNVLVARASPPGAEGEVFGLLQSARSAGFLIGPVLGGALFDLWIPGPYLLAGVSCLCAGLFGWLLFRKRNTWTSHALC